MLSMIWSLVLPGVSSGNVQAAEVAATGYVTVAVEKFTLGQGYIQVPIQVPYYAGETAAHVLLRAIGDEKLTYMGNASNGFYLRAVHDPNAGAVQIPAYILEHANTIGTRQNEAWLSDFDYTDMSGWMYTVNHVLPSVGMAAYQPQNGDVIRYQYTVHGWGADIGFGYEENYIEPADKDELTSKLAEINSDAKYIKLMENAELRTSYEEAMAVAVNIESSAESIGSALAKLSAALAKHHSDERERIERHLENSLAYLVSSKPTPIDEQEWSVFTLARSGYQVPEGYYQNYYKSIEAKAILQSGSFGTTNTEYARRALTLSAIGADFRDLGGYDLRVFMADSTNYKQGINAYVFTLIALDTRNYDLPVLHEGEKQATREMLIEGVLSREVKRGTEAAAGWAFGSGVNGPDPDMTGMAIQSLAPYYETHPNVKAAVDRALVWLSDNQKSDGGYESWNVKNPESPAQVIVALTSLGIDPHTDRRFIKNGNSPLDAMMGFAVEGGGFVHSSTQTRPDGMATDQCTYALVAYDRFLKGQNRLYDMSDAPDSLPGGLPPIELTLPTGEQPVITVPNDQRAYVIAVQAADRDKDVRIELAEGRTAAVRLQLPAGELPRIEVNQGGVTVVLPQGSEVTSGSDQALTLFGPASITAAQITDKLAEGQELEAIVRQFALGGESRMAFDSYVTLTYPGLAEHGAAFAEQDELTLIQHFDSQAAGEASGADVFSYDAAGSLVIQTKHFTDFVVYKLSPEDSSGGGGGGDPGTNPGTPPATQTVTVSVDKQTIGKGTVLAPTTVTLQAGDTAWSVLQRTLDARNIPYESRFSGEFGSVYVESIAGDGEFDHGEGSGWMYNVNGTYPNVGASAYIVKSGDSIQWRYTTNLGADLGQAPWPGTDPPGPGTNPGTGGGIPGGGGASEQQALTVPSTLTADYTIKLTEEHKKAKHLTVNVPSSTHAVLLDLAAVASSIPQLTATRGELTLHIAEGTKLTAGGPAIRLLHAIEPTLEQREAAILAQENEQTKLSRAFTLNQGEQRAAFDQPLSVTIKGGAKQQAAYQAGDEWQQLRVYASQQAAQASQPGAVYGFVQGQDLVLRTTSATAFITYTVESITAPEPQPEPTDANAIYDDRASMAAWAYEGIARATEYGWLQGSEGLFRPQASITRAEFTKLLSELLELPLSSSSASAFDDVRAGQWFHPYVQAAYEADLVNGYGNRFEPQQTITREQMAVMIARALELPAASGSTILTDAAQIATWARSEVLAVYAAGLMTGDANRFHPQQQVSREMAAVVAVRAFDYLEGAPLPPAPEPEVPAPDAMLQQTQRTIAEAAAYLQRTVTNPIVTSVGGEWTVFGLARSQEQVPSAYYDRYLTNLEQTLKEKDGVLHRLKYTEYDRVILALTALGQPVDDVAGYNLLQPLADYDTLIKQGINGPIFALIALDSRGYEIPAHSGSGTQTSRQQLVDFILNREITGGGWTLDSSSSEADPDVTAMAIQALTPYYTGQARVKAAIDRGIAWLSGAQGADGGYLSWNASNSESAAQVVVALTGLSIDPHTDPRFIKNGHSLLEALLGFAATGGGFYHILPGGPDNGGAKPGEVDVMATDQALYALVAYERFATGKSRLYDLSDAS
ncbi:S-layer homology domain-containing protein [Paenibacillus daejeonensis]|uniref:S-layer homology domain-containing protein n=1 Tax=Paenibacillus daejeonensis TaxID=135193 RepID=UPI001B7FDE05|nr:DUF4430 domain-containing protein [Paenibacillus daejeonensis]